MLGFNGGITGPINAPTRSSASGVWTLREQLLAAAAGNWPGSAATISNTDHAVDASDLTTYTFTSKSLGTAQAGRKIIVVVGGLSGGSITISSVTVAGNSATAVVNPSSSTGPAGIFIIDDSTNATGNIVVTFSGGSARCGIGVFAAYGLNSSTATATIDTTSDPGTGTLNITAGGVAVGYRLSDTYGTTPTYTWTNLTESFDETIESVPKTSHSGACSAFATTQTGLTITVNQSSSASTARMVAASFR